MDISKIIEKFGFYFDEIGMNKTYGRLFGLFMVSAEPISMSQIIDILKISKSTASTELRRLLQMGYIEKVLVEQERADFYRLVKDVWAKHFLQKIEVIKKLHSIVKQIPKQELKSLPHLKQMGFYCEFMREELERLVKKYSQLHVKQ